MHKPCQDKKAVISIEPPRNPTQTGLSGLPCDRACNSNINAVHFCSYWACASSYNAIVLMDRVDFTRAFGDLQTPIDFLGAR